jgi:hypothetical protein
MIGCKNAWDITTGGRVSMVNPFQNLILLQLEMLRSSLMLSQQFMETFVAVQKQIETVTRAPSLVSGARPSPVSGARPSPVSGVEELTRFLVVKPNGCIGAADLKS